MQPRMGRTLCCIIPLGWLMCGWTTIRFNESLFIFSTPEPDFQQYFLSQNKPAAGMDFGNVSSRIQLRKELKCQDFDWYIKNVYPELSLPSDDQERLRKKWSALEHDKFQPWHSRKRNYVAEFQIRYFPPAKNRHSEFI